MGAPALVPVGSRWKSSWKPEASDRVWVVIERKPFGRLVIQEEGRAYFGETYQRMFLESHTRLPDKINQILPDMLAAEDRALKKPARGPRPG